MPMYNLIEYSDNYSGTSESLWQFKKDKVPANNADLTVYNSHAFNTKQLLQEKQQTLLIIEIVL